jgi:hypothetical protein
LTQSVQRFGRFAYDACRTANPGGLKGGDFINHSATAGLQYLSLTAELMELLLELAAIGFFGRKFLLERNYVGIFLIGHTSLCLAKEGTQ